jgi:hypothetical protein
MLPRGIPSQLLKYVDEKGPYPFKITVYQSGDYVAAYINGRLISETKFKGTSPGKIIFSDKQSFHSGRNLSLSDTFVATGKLAWRLKEVLNQSAEVKATGVNPYADMFDINLSGGINKNKQRRGKNKNEVAEAQVNYQTIDVKAKITLRPGVVLTYPAFVNVTYYYTYTEQWDVEHYILGHMGKEYVRSRSDDRQYFLESPTSVIEDTFSLEYAESTVNSDYTNTSKMKIISDPVIDINVTGVADVPK